MKQYVVSIYVDKRLKEQYNVFGYNISNVRKTERAKWLHFRPVVRVEVELFRREPGEQLTLFNK